MSSPVSSRLRPYLVLASLLAPLLFTACSTVPPAPEMVRTDLVVRGCADWFETLDRRIDASGVRDAGSHRVPGHPYLRADRFTASFAEVAREPGPAFERWVDRLRELDLRAREAELRQLVPSAEVRQMMTRALTCGRALQREDLATPAGRERLARAAAVPDDYAEWVHRTGVFALASPAFTDGVRRWYREAQQMFDDTAAGKAHTANLRHVGPAGADVSAAQVREVFARSRRDALGIPVFTPGDEALLFRAFAPHYEVETTGPFDRFGLLAWQAGQAVPQVVDAQPVVYKRLAFTRMNGRVMTQLVYTVWFPERPKRLALDLLGGPLDGLVMRVTLDGDGTPLIWDTMHPCGCYHMFFPTAALRELPPPPQGSEVLAPNPSRLSAEEWHQAPSRLHAEQWSLIPSRRPAEEWSLIPSRLPAMKPADRVAVRTATRTHYLVSVRPATAAPAAQDRYTLVDEDTLRTLPLPGGGVKSLYGPDALVAGTERGERALFWPMGLASPGAMRQWGRHPTAFLDRRHFDDADLLDKRFAPVQQQALK